MMAAPDPNRLELIGEFADWNVTLVTGEVVQVAAHGFSDEKGTYVFSGFLEGEPPVEVTIAKFPKHTVTKIRGG